MNYVHPDIAYFTMEQAIAIDDEVEVRLVPPLVVEILSPSTEEKDRATKRGWYARLGVQEYWLVDPDRELVEVIDLRTGATQQTDPVHSTLLSGLDLPLARIFGL